ncbi:hypothetical protein ACLRDC_12375 [Gluconacetobacter sacchari]|uniref:hypothetical protein n=1 Tax=Gluconacetobacter sacchari TaxID=92759 RepID=UPI0039B3FA62
MLIDESRAPFIFARREATSDIPLDEQFRRLLEKGASFVLLTHHASDDHRDETHEQRKQRALFFKAIKGRMRALCRGMIVIDGADPVPAPMRLSMAIAGKAFGFPIAFVPDEATAIERGEKLLAQKQE